MTIEQKQAITKRIFEAPIEAIVIELTSEHAKRAEETIKEKIEHTEETNGSFLLHTINDLSKKQLRLLYEAERIGEKPSEEYTEEERFVLDIFADTTFAICEIEEVMTKSVQYNRLMMKEKDENKGE